MDRNIKEKKCNDFENQKTVMNIEEWHNVVNDKLGISGGTIYSSSGSTGNSKSIIYTDDVMNAAVRRTKEFISLTPLLSNCKIAILWGYGLFPPASFYNRALSEMGNIVYPFGSGRNFPSELKATKLGEIKPKVIIGMPSYILRICNILKEKKLLEKVSEKLEFIITGGEVLTTFYRKTLEEEFGVKVFDHYGMLQAPMIAGECSEGKMHISKEYKSEVLMSDSKISEMGRGILLLSSEKAWFPLELERLNVEDNVILSKDKCSCGYETPTIKIIGRSNLKYKVRGQLVDFDELITRLNVLGFENKYFVEVKDFNNELIFHISNEISKEKFKEEVNKIISFTYFVESHEKIEFLLTNTGKIKRIIIRNN
ncbi:MAG: hypothetical protein N4A47_03995 [Clostridia bacterium]|jgi:phenylacetate-coenzyme A ligase PaaK-like adenylate-forming protein|nr:hypothetical protein [Clostridia bacterium]